MSAARKVTRKKKDDDEVPKKVGKRTFCCYSRFIGSLLTTARLHGSTGRRLIPQESAAHPQTSNLVSSERQRATERARNSRL